MEENQTVRTGGTDDEIAQLRERLAFYESFDQVIRDNVSQVE